MCYPVYGMVHIKEPLLLIGKSSRFPFSLSEWSLTICLMPNNHKLNVLSASLNKTFPSFLHWTISCYSQCSTTVVIKSKQTIEEHYLIRQGNTIYKFWIQFSFLSIGREKWKLQKQISKLLILIETAACNKACYMYCLIYCMVHIKIPCCISERVAMLWQQQVSSLAIWMVLYNMSNTI